MKNNNNGKKCRSWNRFIFIMGIPIPEKGRYIEMGPKSTEDMRLLHWKFSDSIPERFCQETYTRCRQEGRSDTWRDNSDERVGNCSNPVWQAAREVVVAGGTVAQSK